MSRFFPFIITFLAIVITLDLLWWWLADRGLRRMPGRRWWRLANSAWVLLQIGGLAWLLAGRMRRDWGIGEPAAGIQILVYLWHLLVLPPAVAAMLTAVLGGGVFDLVRLIRRPRKVPGDAAAEGAQPADIGSPACAGDPPAIAPPDPAVVRPWLAMRREAPGEPVPAPDPPPVPRPPMTRRQMLSATLAIAPPVIAGVAGGLAVRDLESFRVRKLDVTLPSLPAALDGLRIAHVTDTHVGRFTHGRMLDRIVAATNDLDADLVLFTGDLLDGQLTALDEAIPMLRAMRGRYGRPVVCEGNHDLFQGRENFENALRSARINLLVNQPTTLRIRGQQIQLLGLRWGSPIASASRGEHRSDRAVAASMDILRPMIRRDAFPILLAHHPHAFDPAAEMGIPLTLAGHTHGGQLMFSRHIGAGNIVGFRYMSGLYQRGSSALVVSNGVGNWFPLRVNAPAEIIDLTLHRG